jgi:hypothetical protein
MPVLGGSHDASRQALLEQLIVALSRLARPAKAQIAYLEALGAEQSVDELALELDDVAEAALSTPGLLSVGQQDLLRDLDRQLEAMSGPEHADLWSQRGLGTSPAWTQVRATARAILVELHAEPAASC